MSWMGKREKTSFYWKIHSHIFFKKSIRAKYREYNTLCKFWFLKKYFEGGDYLFKEFDEIKEEIYLVYQGEFELEKQIKIEINGQKIIKNKTMMIIEPGCFLGLDCLREKYYSHTIKVNFNSSFYRF